MRWGSSNKMKQKKNCPVLLCSMATIRHASRSRRPFQSTIRSLHLACARCYLTRVKNVAAFGSSTIPLCGSEWLSKQGNLSGPNMKFGLIEHDFGDTRSIETNFVVVGGGFFSLSSYRDSYWNATSGKKRVLCSVYGTHRAHTHAHNRLQCPCTGTHIRAHTCTIIHTHARTRTHTHKDMDILAYQYKLTTPYRASSYTLACTSCTHTRTHTHAHTRAHTRSDFVVSIHSNFNQPTKTELLFYMISLWKSSAFGRF